MTLLNIIGCVAICLFLLFGTILILAIWAFGIVICYQLLLLLIESIMHKIINFFSRKLNRKHITV